MNRTQKQVHAEIRDNIGWIEFTAPGANILSCQAFETLGAILEKYKRESIQTLVFSGGDGNFVGGLRLKDMEVIHKYREAGEKTIDYFYTVGAMIREFPITVTAIDKGGCGGLGVEIAGLTGSVVVNRQNALTIKLASLAPRYNFMLGLGASWCFSQKMGVYRVAKFLTDKGVTNVGTASLVGIVDAFLPGNDFKKEIAQFAHMREKGTIATKKFSCIVPESARCVKREYGISGCLSPTVSNILDAIENITRVENFKDAMELDKEYFKKLFFAPAAQKSISDFLRENKT